MKIATMTAVLLTVATAAGAQVMVHDRDAKAAQEHQLQILTEKIAATGAYVSVQTHPVTGAPYSGEATTETIQVLADGNRIVRRTTARVYRDGSGRTRRETIGPDGQLTSVLISDPARGTSFVFDPASNTAHRSGVATYTVMADGRGEGTSSSSATTYHVTADGKREAELKAQQMTELKLKQAAELKAAQETETRPHATGAAGGMVTSVGPVSWVTAGHAIAGAEPPKTEDLGQQVIEGVTAKGTRTTTVIPAGAIGNELPITVTSEEWKAVDLKVLVMTKHSDPRSGETTYRLTGIVRGEPNPSLFEPPAGVTVK
jgi:hypothetical protein